MTGVRIKMCAFAALAGVALAQESVDLRGRSIPENSIERQIAAADLAAEAQAEAEARRVGNPTNNLDRAVADTRDLGALRSRETPWIHKDGLLIFVPSEAMGELGDDLESPWHNQGHMTEARTLRHVILEGLIEAGVAEDRTMDYEVWNQPIVGMARSSTPATSDVPLWVVIRKSTEAISFGSYSADPSKVSLDVTVGRDEQGRAVGGIGNTANDYVGIGLHIGVPTRRHAGRAWWGICHGAAPARLQELFDEAMLGGDWLQKKHIGNVKYEDITLVAADGSDAAALIVPIAMDKGLRFSIVVVDDTFHTSSPGHKSIEEITLRAIGYALVEFGVVDSAPILIVVHRAESAENHNSSRSNKP